MAKTESYILLSPISDENDRKPKNHYLWGHQPHFVSSMKAAAEALFRKLDDSILPDVFLVAINADRDERYPKAVVEPPEHDFKTSDFERVLELAKELDTVSAGVQYGYPSENPSVGEAWMAREMRRDFRAKVRRAVQSTIEGASAHDKHQIYVSAAREVGPFFVFSVLLIATHHYESHPKLRTNVRGDYAVTLSLLDATASSYLSACFNTILISLDGDGFAEFPSSDTMLRSAGDTFMYTATGVCNNIHGLHGAFATCNEISTLTYERALVLASSY